MSICLHIQVVPRRKMLALPASTLRGLALAKNEGGTGSTQSRPVSPHAA